MKEDNNKTTFTKAEKKLIISEATGISFGLVLGIIAGVYFVSQISGKVDANTNALRSHSEEYKILKKTYIEHTRITDDNFNKLGTEIGKLSGKIDVLLYKLENKGNL
jgi:hypothetical protein